MFDVTDHEAIGRALKDFKKRVARDELLKAVGDPPSQSHNPSIYIGPETAEKTGLSSGDHFAGYLVYVDRGTRWDSAR